MTGSWAKPVAARLRRTIGRDRPTRAAAALFAIALIATPARAGVAGEVLALALAAAAVVAVGREAFRGGAWRRPWPVLALAVGAWFLAAAAGVAPEWMRGGDLPIRALLTIFFVGLALAAEDGRPRAGDDVGSRPIPAILVLGLLLYFDWLPATLAPADAAWPPPYLLYAALHAYLAGRFLLAARAATAPRRRTALALLAVASAALLIHRSLLLPVWPRTAAAAWLLAPAAYLLAARVRATTATAKSAAKSVARAHVAATDELAAGEPGTPRPGRPDALQSRAMAAALIFALIHFGTYALDLGADLALRGPRSLLALVWLLLLGTVALLQRRRLEQRARTLEKDRRRFERSLRANEQDLRVIIERRSARQALGASEEKFARAFRFAPDAIGISTTSDGRFVDVNPAFERLTGHHREDILGHTSSELGIWFDPADRTRIVRAVEERGDVRDLRLPFRTKTGERRIALFSAQPIDIGGEHCLIIVGHDVTGLVDDEPDVDADDGGAS